MAKRIPKGADLSAAAGPYSPVLEVEFNKLVVISGQLPINTEGKLVGNTIEEQTIAALENCKKQLACASCTFDDVFKVNIFLASLSDFAAMNKIYSETLPAPMPTRTTVQAVLLPGFLVEIEMWAAKD